MCPKTWVTFLPTSEPLWKLTCHLVKLVSRFPLVAWCSSSLPMRNSQLMMRSTPSRTKGPKITNERCTSTPIRSRCQVKDFELSPLVQWGWVADVILNEDCGVSDIPNDVLRELLRFTYRNWSDLKTKSIRTFQMMLNEYRQFPSEYAEVWEMEYLK